MSHPAAKAMTETALGAPLPQPQVARVMDLLGTESTYADELRTQVRAWKKKQTPGLGANGRVDGVTEQIDPQAIWVNPDIYVWSEDDLAFVNQPTPDWNNAVIASDRENMTTASGLIGQYNFEPILVIARPLNDEQPLMLWRGYRDLQIALTNGWRFIKTLVYPDLPDYTLRDIGLRRAMAQSRPPVREVFRTLYCMEQDYLAGRRTGDAPPPPSQTAIAELIGCTQANVSYMATVWDNPTARVLVAQQRLPVATAVDVLKGLKPYPELVDDALQHIAQEQLKAKPAHQWIEHLIQQQTPTVARTGISQTRAYLRELRKAFAILRREERAISEEIGELAYQDALTHTTQLLKQVEDAFIQNVSQ